MKEGVRKFACVGTTSSGKSTLARQYERSSVFLGREGPRILLEENQHLLELPVHVFPFQLPIQNFVREIERADGGQAVRSGKRQLLTDGAVLDAIVLVRFYGDEGGAGKLLDNVHDWIPTYDKFFLLSPDDVPYAQDHFRQETPRERFAIHEAYRQFLSEQGLPFVEISGSISERVQIINQVIFEQTGERVLFSK